MPLEERPIKITKGIKNEIQPIHYQSSRLNAGYGWKAPWSHLQNRSQIFDVLHDEYQKEIREESPDWQGRVESTASLVDSCI
jgi:hypothetical protein